MSAEYIRFTELQTAGKTQTWFVENKKHGDELGLIKWHGAWRQYCYFPSVHAVYSAGCLEDITKFIKAEMQKRKVK